MHALFPAGAKARAVRELLRIGWLLARRFQGLFAGTTQAEVALRGAAEGGRRPLFSCARVSGRGDERRRSDVEAERSAGPAVVTRPTSAAGRATATATTREA
jgi:hypothetical protein